MNVDFTETDMAEIGGLPRIPTSHDLGLSYETTRLFIDKCQVRPVSDDASEEALRDSATVVAAVLGTFRFVPGVSAASLLSVQVTPETVIGTLTVLEEVIEMKAGVQGMVIES